MSSGPKTKTKRLAKARKSSKGSLSSTRSIRKSTAPQVPLKESFQPEAISQVASPSSVGSPATEYRVSQAIAYGSPTTTRKFSLRELVSTLSLHNIHHNTWFTWFNVGISVLILVLVVLVAASAVTVWIVLRERVTSPSDSTPYSGILCDPPPSEPKVSLTTLDATVHGKLDNSGNLRLFFGIPYGRNVSATRRFQLAERVTSLGENGSFYAYRHGPQCPQENFVRSGLEEECLTLSIWAPVACTTGSPLKAVLVIVASEWFQFPNAGNLHRAWETLSLGGDIIVVTIKHRLGLLGFLETNDTNGYAGIDDVFLALSWIREHIQAFHGDASTLAGLGFGSGAYIVSMDLFAEALGRKRFFKRLLLHGISPASLLPRLQPEDLRKLMSSLQCPNTESTSSLLECLRTNNLKRIFAEASKLGLLFTPNCDQPPFGGCDSIFGKLPTTLAGIDILCGYNRNDVYDLFSRYILKESAMTRIGNPEEFFDKLEKFFSGRRGTHAFKQLPARVRQELNNSGKAIEHRFSELVSDMVLHCPMSELAREVAARGASVHLYGSDGPHKLLEPALMMADIIAFVKRGYQAVKAAVGTVV
ncbi:hypothetical protein HPB50_020054 [Hyalomma asiaticum]|uniref:Uncharacterized protein n=1 Tax=Hyalomma asiaticum TaxID=266040 RepID=A0ACB7S802_HYAAI|nr:hypothetical protein HPB50_020054 [Hyalomma asiaticum]